MSGDKATRRQVRRIRRVRRVRRVRIDVEGTVQGVGFRPFVYRLARELDLAGLVRNTTNGLMIEVEGHAATIEQFLHRLRADAPVSALVEAVTVRAMLPCDQTDFSIHTSEAVGHRALVVPPDLAICPDCLRELNEPSDRRCRYPFITCTQCGPRYSVITDMPYDRLRTTMEKFRLCAACQAEYESIESRRFHAESIACPLCGPQVALWDERGCGMAQGEEAMAQAVRLLREGLILAVKGLGGFQLWVDARSDEAVRRLRVRKQRPDKPFAVLFPSLQAARIHCVLSPEEETLLTSPTAPIVLVRRHPDSSLARAVAPGNPFIGALLPTTPLHHLLMQELKQPMVATSGNRSDEPIVIDEQEAVRRLDGIADAFLVHDRPIARPVDDSVVRVCVDGGGKVGLDATIILRRARGYAPQAIRLKNCLASPNETVLALGGHLKNTIALLQQDRVWMSQHLGDLSTLEADHAFRQTVEDLQRLLHVTPSLVACDLHPDYRSSILARELAAQWSVPLVAVQHHHAHVVSCMAEHGLEGPVLGVAWDGAGYGTDGVVWGGEFLIAEPDRFERFAHLRPFRLPGGEAAMKEPARSAASLLWDLMGEQMPAQWFSLWPVTAEERERLVMLMKSPVTSAWTTSVGRLFDAVASLTGLCQRTSFEGQAAMVVEFAAEQGRVHGETGAYCFEIAKTDRGGNRLIVDWRPMVTELVQDLQQGASPERIAARFHHGLAQALVRIAQAAGLPHVVLTGGCFQNGLLRCLARQGLEKAGFIVYCHRLVPPNDGGLSLGQAVVAACQVAHRHSRRT
ncbi:MAG: carbamoyltransferase HypF [Nitrospira sp.]|nr:carbamoyltransferase HypF [Nitrospira sp.]MCP9461706.1 carbamoyltransferase HypF [Nitrospira sp.]MCP9473678.1 carbamoyltransferase HypF [Nitrospira sp.]